MEIDYGRLNNAISRYKSEVAMHEKLKASIENCHILDGIKESDFVRLELIEPNNARSFRSEYIGYVLRINPTPVKYNPVIGVYGNISLEGNWISITNIRLAPPDPNDQLNYHNQPWTNRVIVRKYKTDHAKFAALINSLIELVESGTFEQASYSYYINQDLLDGLNARVLKEIKKAEITKEAKKLKYWSC